MPSDRIVDQNNLYDDDSLLRAYRRTAIARKRQVYWLGFLEGARASGRIERDEPVAIEAEAARFIQFFDDPDARDMYLDIKAGCIESEDDLLGSLEAAVLAKREELIAEQAFSEVDHLNEFLGFCAGIICDGRVLKEEVAAILDKFHGNPALMAAPAFSSLRDAVQRSMIDGIVTEEESAEVQEWLARLVGDGYVDTGISNIGNVAQFHGAIHDPNEISIQGSRFVLTGPMAIGTRSSIVAMIEGAGGIFDERPTRSTHFVVVATTASRLWRTTHYGTKIDQTIKLIEAGHAIRFAAETAFERALFGALGSAAAPDAT